MDARKGGKKAKEGQSRRGGRWECTLKNAIKLGVGQLKIQKPGSLTHQNFLIPKIADGCLMLNTEKDIVFMF